MADNEEDDLSRCLEQDICPVCQQSIAEKFGSGQLKDGVFCSLDCYAKWHEALLMRRHQDRVQKGGPNE